MHALVERHPNFQAVHAPQLTAVNFRHAPHGAGDLDAHNVRLARAIQNDGRIYLAPSLVDGVACLRACFVNYRTTDDDVRALLDVVEDLADR